MKINWIIEISDYQVENDLEMKINQVINDNKSFLNFAKLDIILIPFDKNPGFEKTLEKYSSYFFNIRDLKTLPINEDAFALYVPDNLLNDLDLCLIVAKVYKYMGVSLLHELFHKLFENNNIKKNYMPRSYFREGIHFNTYLEEFFVEFLAIESNFTEIFNEKSNTDEYLELNDITEKNISEKTLVIYQGFKKHGRNDLKGLIISLLSCYYIFFSIWRKTLEIKPEFEEDFKELWNKIFGLKELEFFKKILEAMQKIFIEENIASIADKMQLLFNSL